MVRSELPGAGRFGGRLHVGYSLGAAPWSLQAGQSRLMEGALGRCVVRGGDVMLCVAIFRGEAVLGGASACLQGTLLGMQSLRGLL